jgi:hypothetical protein
MDTILIGYRAMNRQKYDVSNSTDMFIVNKMAMVVHVSVHTVFISKIFHVPLSMEVT